MGRFGVIIVPTSPTQQSSHRHPAGCPHLAHVKTQIPYAMLAMLMASLCGYVYVGLGGYLSLAYVMGGLGLFIVVRLFGRQADHHSNPIDSSDLRTLTGCQPQRLQYRQ